MNESRSAVDVLLALENKVDTLMQMFHNLDLNIKIISNKLNQNLAPALPSSENATEVFSNFEQALAVETAPAGPRRTARPTAADFESNMMPTPSLEHVETFTANNMQNMQEIPGARKQVSQRVVDKNSKAIFMANVEILNVATNVVEIKTRTSAIGKWQASLAHGQYKVKISKLQTADKDKNKIESIQDLVISEKTPSDLQMIIIK